MSDTRKHLCGNIMLKSVKMHLFGNTDSFGVLKSSQVFSRGSEFFFSKLVH